uniref:Uncharacterized protein n=1 Tax=Fagus sylvatica TaxID=28930 RepID=A0A2N9J2L2_FAGSY
MMLIFLLIDKPFFISIEVQQAHTVRKERRDRDGDGSSSHEIGPSSPDLSEPKTTGNLNNQKPQWRSEQPTTKNHRGAASRPVVSSLLPWRSEQRKRGRASRRGLGGYRSDQRATPWVSWWWLAVHAVGLLVVHAVGLLVLGPCFTPWRLRSLRNPGNLKKEQPRTTVVRASRRGLGGYRSDQRATPWVSWWWLVVPVEAGC